jgi:Terminase large subunit, T4likevirus-type, N-terminal
MRFYLQPKQAEYVRCSADIVVFGGSAGGGKSRVLLYEPVSRDLHKVKGFNATIFRRESKQVTSPGGLWDEASEIYPYFSATAHVGSLEYRFPKHRSKIAFRHIEHEEDKHKYQGSQFAMLGFDELTHFSEGQFWYMLSRNRSTCGVKPYVRATCNPDPNWVRDLLSPWVADDHDGSRAASGEIRWLIRDKGVIKWVDQGTPHAKSLAFIRSSVYDNAALLDKDPGYIATLMSLPEVERARLLDGDWNIRREGLVYPGFDACIVESHPDLPLDGGGIDYGWNNPFAALWGFIDHDDVMWVIGCRYQRQTTMPVHAEAIPKGPSYWSDPAQPESTAQMRSHGHHVLPCVHRPSRGASGEMKKPLLAGIDMVSERIRTNRLRIYRADCLPLIREMSMYHYDPDKRVEEPVKIDDHTPDCLRYWIVGVDRNRESPLNPVETLEQTKAREQAAKQAERTTREEKDRISRGDPLHPIWWEGEMAEGQGE